jgi:hypothetical protein
LKKRKKSSAASLVPATSQAVPGQIRSGCQK